MVHPKVLILGAGYGTRLQKDLQNNRHYHHLLGVPKALLPMGDKDSLITHWLELLQQHGFSKNDIHLVTNDACHPAFCDWADRHQLPRTQIASDGTTSNANRLGAVPDIWFGITHFDLQQHNVLVIGGDTLFLNDFDLTRFLQAKQPGHSLVTLYTVPDDLVHKVGIVETDSHGRITSFLEKPAPETTDARQACPCFYLFDQQSIALIGAFLDDCKNKQLGLDHFDATGKALSYLYPRHTIYTYPIAGRIDVGGLASYLEANAYFQSTQSL
ncbi:nucleotide-diphospho-sugar transferase [Hesseltinella vesiculosa]|uniref:Nucleotide-diphospho-sugar transferase n=1 Tax=Hesseltinella vesiculosa TaxID=101127 RepID=A0A1X2GP28_9FUNG|nr:nucleotide-diphospho-sugar transferase [Hesseltinella vesiculosa]